MTLEDIANLTLENTIQVTLGRLLARQEIPFGQAAYRINPETKDFYESIEVAKGLEKPTVEMLELEFLLFKDELLDEENARLAEMARVADITARFNAIADTHGAFFKAEKDIANPAMELKRIIEENDLDALGLYEQTSLEWVADNQLKDRVETSAKRGAAIRAICHKAYNVIIGWNHERRLTDNQLDRMELVFAEPLKALTVTLRPDKAYRLIYPIPVDGVLITQEMKDQVLGVLADAALI